MFPIRFPPTTRRMRKLRKIETDARDANRFGAVSDAQQLPLRRGESLSIFLCISRSAWKPPSGLSKSENGSSAGLMRGVRLIKRHAHDTEGLMKLIFAVEASQPGGAYFRMAFGVSLIPPLAWVAHFARLF